MATGVPASTATQPASRTISTLETDILLYVGMPTDSDSRDIARKGIQAAIRRMNTRPWKWSLTFYDITSASQFDFSIATDVKAPRALELQDSSGNPNGRLDYKDPKTFLIEHPRAFTTGSPRVYTIFSHHERQELTLNRQPTTSWVADHPTMRLWYMRTILLPNNSQDVLDVPIGFEHFVEWYGNWYMARIFAPDRARDAKDEWQSAWVEIIADDNETHDWAEAH